VNEGLAEELKQLAHLLLTELGVELECLVGHQIRQLQALLRQPSMPRKKVQNKFPLNITKNDAPWGFKAHNVELSNEVGDVNEPEIDVVVVGFKNLHQLVIESLAKNLKNFEF